MALWFLIKYSPSWLLPSVADRSAHNHKGIPSTRESGLMTEDMATFRVVCQRDVGEEGRELQQPRHLHSAIWFSGTRSPAVWPIMSTGSTLELTMTAKSQILPGSSRNEVTRGLTYKTRGWFITDISFHRGKYLFNRYLSCQSVIVLYSYFISQPLSFKIRPNLSPFIKERREPSVQQERVKTCPSSSRRL